MINSGRLRGEKVEYPDGIGTCVWYPLSDGDEEAGLCFDFDYEDVDDFIALLEQLKTEPARKYEEPPLAEPQEPSPFQFLRHWIHDIGWWLLSK